MNITFKNYRLKRKLTLEKTAEKAEISWRNLQRIENGTYKNAKFATIAKLMIELDMSDEDILKIIKESAK